MQLINIKDLDVIFITYDEPNAEQNWFMLKSKISTAKRVHGVKGSDASHKQAALIAETDRFITIDGDNVLTDAYGFLEQVIEIHDSVDIDNVVISWPSFNVINGLMYGNGGIKCWPKKAVLEMRTHESAPADNIKAQVDFCWELNYLAIDRCFSKIFNNYSARQAWRAGFREGVKMCLNDGVPVNNLRDIAPTNLRRLKIWMTIGIDAKYGIYSMLGALQGTYLVRFSDWDYTDVRDFDKLDEIWREEVQNLTEDEIHKFMDFIRIRINSEIFVPKYLDENTCIFLKQLDINTERQISTISSDFGTYDIVMITYDEEEADLNWSLLYKRFPRAKRVRGIKGIHNAHKYAASLCKTEMFWVVDGDTKVFDNFDFDYIVPKTKRDIVHVWRARNPVNGLEYGYGGIKLLPRQLTLEMDTSTTDMTTSISSKYKAVMEVASITAFNTAAESTWRSAFRECVKLSGNLIRNADKNTQDRLRAWQSIGTGRFGQYAIAGANAGTKFIKDNPDSAHKINDYDFLHKLFIEEFSDGDK